MPELTDRRGTVTKEFNEYCTREGIQATVTMDSRDWKTLIELVNVGKQPIEVKQGFYRRTLDPGQAMSMKPGPNPRFEEVGRRTVVFYL
jgi:hypothetical protein